MASYIERFRNKTAAVSTSLASDTTDIIALSPSATEIHVERLDKAIPAIFLTSDKESGDEAVIYTYTADGVRVGDYVEILDSTFLVYKEIKNLTREGYISSFKMILCNVAFEVDSAQVYANYKGPLRGVSSEETDLAQNFGVDSKGESLLMLPSGIITKRNILITISNKGFRITNFDDMTNPGITYYALEEYNLIQLDKISDPGTIDPLTPVNTYSYFTSGIDYNIITEDAYIAFSVPVTIISRTLTNVRFTTPYDIASLTIGYKVDGVITTTVYTVRR